MFALFYHIAKDITTDWNNIFRTVCLKTDKADDALRKAIRTTMPQAPHIRRIYSGQYVNLHTFSAAKNATLPHILSRAPCKTFSYTKSRGAQKISRAAALT